MDVELHIPGSHFDHEVAKAWKIERDEDIIVRLQLDFEHYYTPHTQPEPAQNIGANNLLDAEAPAPSTESPEDKPIEQRNQKCLQKQSKPCKQREEKQKNN